MRTIRIKNHRKFYSSSDKKNYLCINCKKMYYEVLKMDGAHFISIFLYLENVRI